MNWLIKQVLLWISVIGLTSNIHAQDAKDSTYLLLKKRYGNVQAWGNGYIIQANNAYAFADGEGRIVLPFVYGEMKPVLNDRMILNSSQPAIANADGKVLYNSSSPITLLNSDKRRFVVYNGTTEIILNDSGQQITYGLDTTFHEQTMVHTHDFRNGTYYYGLVNRMGEVVLPNEYIQVSAGKSLYAAIHGDTLLVWDTGHGLLFKTSSFHGVKILRNGMITVKKYGAWALMSRVGKLLTKFQYYEIKDFLYPYSIYPTDPRNGKTVTPDAIPGLAIVGNQPQGLINDKGQEVLPKEYDDIDLNTNGWFILRKVRNENESLVDDKFKTIVEAEAYKIKFLDNRYASISSDVEDKPDKIFDMQTRHFTTKRNTKNAVQTVQEGQFTPPMRMTNYLNLHGKDSFFLNPALTLLHKKNGLWGVTSITGDTVLPFLYDSASPYYPTYVFKDGRYAFMDWDGSLLTPLNLPQRPMLLTKDSQVVMAGGIIYDMRTQEISKIDFEVQGYDDGHFNSLKGGMYVRNDKANGIPEGIYNRNLCKISNYQLLNRGSSFPTPSGLVAVTDSSGKKVGVIDSTGKLRMPFQPRPKHFLLRNETAILVNDTGKSDLIYTFSPHGDSSHTIHFANNKKRAWTGMPDEILGFTDPLKGFITKHSGRTFFMDDFKSIQSSGGEYILTTMTNGAMVYDAADKAVLPKFYDSIENKGNGFILFKDSKMGAYESRSKALFPPIYDSVGSINSLRDHFLLVKKGDRSYFVDEKGKPISPQWNIPFYSYNSYRYYGAISGLVVQQDGRKYKLYATPADILLAVPDDEFPSGFTIKATFDDGNLIASKDGLFGVYYTSRKKWIIPPQYQFIDLESSTFVAVSKTTTYMYNTDGKLLFKVKGQYTDPKPVYNTNQWYMGGWHPAVPVVNNKGKIIVPAMYKWVALMNEEFPLYYEAETENDKHAVYDTNGKQLLPPVFDFVEGYGMQGYYKGAIDDRSCLISPEMKQLTPAIYENIYPENQPQAFFERESNLIYSIGDRENTKPFFICMKNETDSFGVLDFRGRVMIPAIYDSIKQVTYKEIVVAQRNGKWGLLTIKNKPVTAFIYDRIDYLVGGKCRFVRGNLIGFLKENGEEASLQQDAPPSKD